MATIKAKDQVTVLDITDAYSVILTSEAYTFVGNTSGAPSGLSCSTQVVAYQGSTPVQKITVTVTPPSGITANIAGNGGNSPTITFTTTSTITASCEATIAVKIDDTTINKKFSFSVAKQGSTGSAGKGIKSTTITYRAGSSGTTPPTGTWVSSPPKTTAAAPYMWTKTVITYTDNSTSTSYSVGSTPEGIQVGGRNLIRGSANMSTDIRRDNAGELYSDDGYCGCVSAITNTAWRGPKIKMNSIVERLQLKAGDTVTMSIWVSTNSETEVTTPALYLYRANGSTQTKAFGAIKLKKGQWIQLAATYELNSDMTFEESARFECSAATDYFIFWSAPKLELGNIATDWTPAPEDMATSDALDIAKSTLKDYVSSRGENLITNGTAMLGDNTNFSTFEYDGSDTYYAGGSFKSSNIQWEPTNDEYIPIDTANKYLFSYWIKTDNSNARFYDAINSYDIDKEKILAEHVMWIPGSTTTLAKDLKNGDTVVYLKSANGFATSTAGSYQRGLIFWNYTNSKGYTYETETYSRNRWENLWDEGSAINKSNNTITLKSAWSNGTFAAGTSVSQCSSGATYIYLNSDYTLPVNTWTQRQGYICGVDKNNKNTNPKKFREGTAFIKIGWLMNRNVSKATTWLSTISFTQNVGLADVIASVDVEYYLSTSATSLSGGSWSTTAPAWVNGKYMWSRTVKTDGVGNKTYSPSQNGVCIAGAKGDTGSTGAAGKGVSSIVEQYYKSTSATALDGGSWSTTYPGWENGKYIWTRSAITYTDSTTPVYTTAICVTGEKGDTGAKGDKGETGPTGNGIGKITEHYAVSTSNTSPPTSWQDTPPAMTATNKYLWNYETITYTSGSPVDTKKRVIGVYGDKGNNGTNGTNGKSIGSVINYYLATNASSNVNTDTSGWTTTVQSVSADKKYLWNYEVIKYTDGTTVSTSAPCIIGAYGDKGNKGDKGDTGETGPQGDTGATGTSVTETIRYYKLQDYSDAAPSVPTDNPPSDWSSIEPSYQSGKTLYFIDVTTFSNDSVSYSPVSISSAYQAADNAYQTAIDTGTKLSAEYNEFKMNYRFDATGQYIGRENDPTQMRLTNGSMEIILDNSVVTKVSTKGFYSSQITIDTLCVGGYVLKLADGSQKLRIT